MGFLGWATRPVEDAVLRRQALMREVQMSVGIAHARDTLVVFGTPYALFLTTVTARLALGKHVPGFAAVPAIVGGLVLGNVADMAYGNKMARVLGEAEAIMEHERHRLVPPKQAPFRRVYDGTPEAAHPWATQSTPVGRLWPSLGLKALFDAALGSPLLLTPDPGPDRDSAALPK